MRKPKRVIVVKTLREWLAKNEKLEPDQIVVVDYETKDPIATGMLIKYDQTNYSNFVLDENQLWTPGIEQRGISHVVADGLTGLQFCVLEAIVVLANRTDKGTSQFEYGKAIDKMKEVVQSLCHLPFDFVLTCHYQGDKDEITGKIKEQIQVYGKALPNLIASMMDDIYFAFADASSGRMEYWWGTNPQMLLKCIRQRSFDDLPIKIKANFSEQYKGTLYPVSKKNILIIGDVGVGKTVSIETLPGGTVLFNFDPGGWRSLQR